MSQLKKFQEAAEQAERDLLAANPPEPEPVPEPPIEEAKPEPEPEPIPAVDDEKYKAAVRAMNEAQRKAAEAAKREEEFTKEKQALEAKLQEALERAQKAAEKPQPVDEEEDELERDLPEVTKIAKRAAEKAKLELQKELADLKKWRSEQEERFKTSEQEVLARAIASEVKTAHPDYEQVVASEEMVAWVNNEAPPIYKAIFEGTVPSTGKDRILVLDAFKATRPAPKKDSATPSDTKAPVKDSPAIQTKTQTKKLPTEAEMIAFSRNIHRMTPEQIAEFEARLEA